jgi:hypothetical protein
MDGECLNIFKRHVAFWSSFPVPPVYFSDKPFVIKNYKKTKIELWISLYNSPRNEEMLHALELNIKNPLISKINVLMEDTLLKIRPEIAFNPKISVIFTEKKWRTKYCDLINLIPTSSENINIILNSDIVLSYEELDKLYALNNDELVVLTRHEIDKKSITIEDYKKTCVYEINCASTDVWIFRGFPTIVADIYLGIPGCENMFIMEFVNKNYKVFNLGHIIPAYHVHKHRNHSSVYPFTYYFSKNFKITFIKSIDPIEECKDIVEPSLEECIEGKILKLTQAFNNEFKQYTTLLDVYNTTLDSEIKTIGAEFINRTKDDMKRELDVFYEKEIELRRIGLNKHLEEKEIEFTAKLKDDLEKKFTAIYEEEFLLKKKSLEEQIEREKNEFKINFEETQRKAIEDYKSAKFKEIDSEISAYDRKMRNTLDEEINITKNSMMGKLVQELTLTKEKQEVELNLMIEENTKIFTKKKDEMREKHNAEIQSQKQEIDIINTQIVELKIEEQALREKNQHFLVEIDNSCEQYRNQKITHIEKSLEDISNKLIREEEFFHTTILSNNEEIEKSWKLCVLESKECIADLNNKLNYEKMKITENHEHFVDEINNKKINLNNDFNRMLEEMNSEMLKMKDKKLEELNNEIVLERERYNIKLSNEVEVLKKSCYEEFDVFKKQMFELKKEILLETENFRKIEYEKVGKIIEDYTMKCRRKVDSELEKYLFDQQNATNENLQKYENTRKIEISDEIQKQEKMHNESLAEYAKNIDNRMKDEYNKLISEQEKAVIAWNAEYLAEQQKLNSLRVEKNNFLVAFSKQTDTITLESRDKISQDIKIFNIEYVDRLSKMKENLENVKSKILLDHEDLRRAEIAKIESIIEQKKAEFELEHKERESELMDSFARQKITLQEDFDKESSELMESFAKQKLILQEELESERSEGNFKIINEINKKRVELDQELEDELKTFRTTQVEGIYKEIEESIIAKFEKTFVERDEEDKKNRDDGLRQFNEYIEELRRTEIENIKITKESIIGRLDVRITELRKELFELEKNIRNLQK